MKTDQIDKNLIGDLSVMLVILIVTIGGSIILHIPSILLGGGLALLIVVVAEYVWSRSDKQSHP